MVGGHGHMFEVQKRPLGPDSLREDLVTKDVLCRVAPKRVH